MNRAYGFALAYQESKAHTFLDGKYLPGEEAMSAPHIPAADAARALDEVRAVRDRVITTDLIPDWYWPVLGGLILMFVASIESGRVWITIPGSILFAAGMGAVVGILVQRRRVQLRADLLGVRGALAITAFTVGLVAIGLGVALALRQTGFDWPGTVAVAVVAVVMTATGPLLVRHLQRVMLARPVGNDR